MRLPHRTAVSSFIVLVISLPVNAAGQNRRRLVFGHVGLASIGHSDSEQGKARIFGGGAAFDLTPRLIVEGDLHAARVSHVFGRPQHDFTELTVTGSLLYRGFADRRVHLLAGGGYGLQRAHSAFTVAPVGAVDRTDVLGLWHWRAGAEWDVSNRAVVRTEAVSWFGVGLDWVMGGRLSVGYRF
jgi:outer membrane protein with beta-barrel domain